MGGVSFLPASTEVIGGAAGVCASSVTPMKAAPVSVAANVRRARVIESSRGKKARKRANYTLQLAVPVLRLRVHRPEDLHVPLAAAPWLDDFGGDDVDQDFRED